MSRPSRATAQGRAYLDLRAIAHQDGRNTDELLQLYALEGFLSRMSASRHASRLILKGGVLLAAFGNRRPTRDIDLQGIDLSNDREEVLRTIQGIARIELQDGLRFDAAEATAAVIRDQDQYSGVRVTMDAELDRARLRFHVDVNVGDPIWPAPELVHVPRLLGGRPIAVSGYPLHMVHAEKIVTAVQRGTANTRWRDFADIWALAHDHPVDGLELQHALQLVAAYRSAMLAPLAAHLDGYASSGQRRWELWRMRHAMKHVPTDFTNVLNLVCRFADPAIRQAVTAARWDPVTVSWTAWPMPATP